MSPTGLILAGLLAAGAATAAAVVVVTSGPLAGGRSQTAATTASATPTVAAAPTRDLSGVEVSVAAGSSPILPHGLGAKGSYRDGPPGEGELREPVDIAMAPNGDVVIAEVLSHRVRRMTPDGTLSTVAGDGEEGVRDGPALQAQFRGPLSVAVDDDGTIYVSDAQSYQIRKISPDGVVSTLAGRNYLECHPPDVKDQPNPPLPADCPKDSAPWWRDGVGTEALFDEPAGIAVDGRGHLVVADGDNQCIRQIDLKNRAVSTLAGLCGVEGSNDGKAADARFFMPIDVAVDRGDDSVYVSEVANRIRRITPAGMVETVVGNGQEGDVVGPAKDTRVRNVTGLALLGPGALVFSDMDNQKIKLLERGVVRIVAGAGGQGIRLGPGATAQFSNAIGVAVAQDGTIYVSDYALCRVFRITGVK